MAKMLRDERQVLKAVTMAVEGDVIAILIQRYHTEANPETGKIDRSKSFYEWLMRIDTKENFRKLANWYLDDSRRLERGKWVGEEDAPWYFCVGDGSENFRIGEFINNKLKKEMSWEMAQKKLYGWETKTEKREEGYNTGAKCIIEGYKDKDGNAVDILSKEELMKHVGQNLTAPQIMKSKLPPVKTKKARPA